MLNQFVRLSDADSILRFAKKWGVLALSNDLGDLAALPGRESMRKGFEPFAAWQYYSRRARAVLNIAAALKQGKLGDLSDWDEFAIFFSDTRKHSEVMKWVEASAYRHKFGLGFSILAAEATSQKRIERARHLIATEIEGWLDCWKSKRTTGLSDFALSWNDAHQRWDLQINYHGLLFPAIALQLALVVAAADSLYSCSGCGVPYIRSRERKRPKSGWANYCDQCANEGVSKRRAVESYREKRANAVRLHLSGASAEEIADQLKTDATRVRVWLEKGRH